MGEKENEIVCYSILGAVSVLLAMVSGVMIFRLWRRSRAGQLTTRKTYLALLGAAMLSRAGFFFVEPYARSLPGHSGLEDARAWVLLGLFSNFFFVFSFMYLSGCWLEFYLVITGRNSPQFIGHMSLGAVIKACATAVYLAMAAGQLVACLLLLHDTRRLAELLLGIGMYLAVLLFFLSLVFCVVGMLILAAIRFFDLRLLRSSVEMTMTRSIGAVGLFIALCFAVKGAVLIYTLSELGGHSSASPYYQTAPVWATFVYFLLFECGLSAFVLFLMGNVPDMRAVRPPRSTARRRRSTASRRAGGEGGSCDEGAGDEMEESTLFDATLYGIQVPTDEHLFTPVDSGNSAMPYGSQDEDLDEEEGEAHDEASPLHSSNKHQES